MNIVGRIQIPNTTDVSGLYIKCYEGRINLREGCREVTLLKGGVVSFNSYFNSFYEKLYAKYTELCSLYYLLKLEGNFQVSIYRENYGRENRELVYMDKFEKCDLSKYVKILLPNLTQSEETGRVYLEIMCLSEFGLFTGGLIVTDQAKAREVSLGIITCTFNKENYIINTVNTILEDTFLNEKEFNLFIVDNGRTLKKNDFNNKKVQLIHNKNSGGSGGFTRGLIEALKEDKYTHFLFMDDDIELDSESIYRLISLYEYAKHDLAIAGSMLDLRKKYMLHEAGALYNKYIDLEGHTRYHPFSFTALKHNLDLQNPSSLNFLLIEEKLDYGAFWFFSFSKEVVKKIGLPMPFFIKLDDIEFCLRITKNCSSKIIAFPSIAVWHEPSYTKFTFWESYYQNRNFLITNSIHSSVQYATVVKYITKSIILSLLFFNYNSALMTIKAFEDYMKGPNFLKSEEPEVLHSDILELSKSYKSQSFQHNYSLNTQVYQTSKVGSLKKLISLLTLNGHVIPNFLISDSDALIRLSNNSTVYEQWYNVLPKKGIVIFKEERADFQQRNEIDKLAGIKLLTRWIKAVSNSISKWSAISREWKNASSDLTSTDFWQQYLELKKLS